MKRAALLVALVGLLGVGSAVLVLPRRKSAASGAPVTLPTGPDRSLPPVGVGVATAYPSTFLIDTGPVDTRYIGTGWAYAGVWKDW